jgi:hypothetical protein
MKPQIFCIRFLQFVFVSLFVVSCIKHEDDIPSPENQYLISAQKIPMCH